MVEGKRIILVDDEPDIRDILKEELEYAGAQVFEASNGCEALEKVKTNQFDAILSDVRMPKMDGIELLMKLRRMFPFHPAIALLTGFADIRVDEAFALGATGFFSKPFDILMIIDNIDRLMQEESIRWKQSNRVEGVKGCSRNDAKIFRTEPISELLSLNQLRLGQSGFFLVEQTDHFEKEECISFRLGSTFQGEGIIRWVRTDLSPSYPHGIGVEITKLSPESLDFFLKYREQYLRASLPQQLFDDQHPSPLCATIPNRI